MIYIQCTKHYSLPAIKKGHEIEIPIHCSWFKVLLLHCNTEASCVHLDFVSTTPKYVESLILSTTIVQVRTRHCSLMCSNNELQIDEK